ncbi:MAG: aldehyde ferredoxin oxidoreductase family protein [Candidatus Nezhaarchaeota archaeon]|nr:aldehyde ferredoxin oxidoreductase family protein [Candidatus Nezhaarchaeota archaeon]
MGGLLSKVLYVDLSHRRSKVEERPELFRERIGGVGVGIKLLTEECPRGADPLGPDNVVVLTVGPLTGLLPTMSKTVALFKSPLTKNLGESHAGGRSAIAIRSAGYGAIVIKGSSPTPLYLVIGPSGVKFREASGLWGVASSFTVGRVIREREPGAGLRTIMRIGKAGERLVAYASVVTETYRHFGRHGLGAVLGSKKVKAIVVYGDQTVKVSDVAKYRELYKKVFSEVVGSALMKKYHDLGTAANVLPLNAIGALPVKNLTQRGFEGAMSISGENLAENYLGRRIACAHCPVACIHLAILREPYVDEPYFYKTTFVSYDYELLYALGSMIGISDTHSLLKLIHKVDALGLDAISTGVALAWATEAYEKSLVSSGDLLGLELKWGRAEAYLKAVEYIVDQPNEFYSSLARGVEVAASRYGGLDFALSFGGLEMPGYQTGPAAYAGFLTGARHSHLDSAGYIFDQKVLRGELKGDPKTVSEKLLNEEAWRQVLCSLVACLFAREVYRPALVSEALALVGLELGLSQLQDLGMEVLRDKNKFKQREGFDPARLRIPKRIIEAPTPLGSITEEWLREAVRHYFNSLSP